MIHTEEEEGLTDIAIQKIERDDSAVFTCTAENKAGKVYISFNLRVEGNYFLCVAKKRRIIKCIFSKKINTFFLGKCDKEVC